MVEHDVVAHGSKGLHALSDSITLRPIGGNSGFLGLPGDATPPSRFVRAAFYRATAPQRATGFETVQQCFHLLNNFDVNNIITICMK